MPFFNYLKNTHKFILNIFFHNLTDIDAIPNYMQQLITNLNLEYNAILYTHIVYSEISCGLIFLHF